MVTDLMCMDELEVNTVYPVPIDTQQQIKDFHIACVGEADSALSKNEFVKHHIAGGMYAREMNLPANMVIIGKIHKEDHVCVISKGIVDVVDQYGKCRYESPITFTSKAGTQRVVIALTDTVWTTIHTCGNMTDSDDIESKVVTEDYNYFKGLL